MDNKNSSSVSQNPFYKLSKASVDTYFILLNHYRGLRQTNSLNKDGSFVLQNPEIAKLIGRNPSTASLCIRRLTKKGLIDVKFIPNKQGEIRKIYLRSLESFGDLSL